jgi:hypothetical protein
MNDRLLSLPVIRAIWAPLVVLILHGIFGDLFGHEPVVDPISHFCGGAAIAWFVWEAQFIIGEKFGRPNRLCIECLMLCVTCTAAVFWEFGEFFSDVFLGTNVQRSLSNTMRDLILGALGGGIILAANRVLNRRAA